MESKRPGLNHLQNSLYGTREANIGYIRLIRSSSGQHADISAVTSQIGDDRCSRREIATSIILNMLLPVTYERKNYSDEPPIQISKQPAVFFRSPLSIG